MIYLDANSTTVLHPQALRAMMPYLTACAGNPSSKHAIGLNARQAIEIARNQIATFMSCFPNEIHFTSGGTESIATAFHCALSEAPRPIILSSTEHQAVISAANYWKQRSCAVTNVAVDANGQINLDDLEHALKINPEAFVSVILVNNETGAVSDIAPIASLCQEHGALLHVDAVQAPTRTDINLEAPAIDYISFSAHKFHGPQGVGLLYIRKGSRRNPLLPGFQDEMRPGTANVPGIVGTAEALKAQTLWKAQQSKTLVLRDMLEKGILDAIPDARINCRNTHRVANTTNIAFPGRNAADLVSSLSQNGVCASAGSACHRSGPSHVILALGHDPSYSNSCVRFSLDITSQKDDIINAIRIVTRSYNSTPSTWGSA